MGLIEIRKRQILELCKTCLSYYINYLTDEQKNIISSVLDEIDGNDLNKIEEKLTPIVRKIWDVELNSGEYVVISWNKYFDKKDRKNIFATINKKDNIIPFCGMTEGIKYKISYDAIIGALEKDGATLIEDMAKKGEYTIGVVNNKVINSYNGATKLITPIQLVSNLNNDYKSKHNELILNTDLVEEIGPFTLEDKKI